MTVEDLRLMVRRQGDTATHKLQDILPKLAKRGGHTTLANLASAIGTELGFVVNQLTKHYIDVSFDEDGNVKVGKNVMYRVATAPPKRNRPGATGVNGSDQSAGVGFRKTKWLP